jgi:hypothetical protein
MRAYIEGIHALKAEDASMRILTTEPLVSITAAEDATAIEHVAAAIQHENQYQATDILCGRICPELGGSPELLDIIGVNYYYNNQWIAGNHQTLGWNDDPRHPNWRPLSGLLREVHERYQRPLVLSETSHPHEDRPLWIRDLARECRQTNESGVPLWGVCWYPIIDRPDWDHLDQWHRSGLWDRGYDPEEEHTRTLHQPSATAFRAMQHELGNA